MTIKTQANEVDIRNQIRIKLRREVMDGTTSLNKAVIILSQLGYIYSSFSETETRQFLGLNTYKISNAPRSFVMFFIALNIPFSFRDNIISIEASDLDIENPTIQAFWSFCTANGVRPGTDLQGVSIDLI